MSSKDLKKGTKERVKKENYLRTWHRWRRITHWPGCWWRLRRKPANKMDMQDLVLYETVTFLVELPGPVKNRELRQPWGQLHDHCTTKKWNSRGGCIHKTNVIFPFRSWMYLTPGKLASSDKLGKAKVNKFETNTFFSDFYTAVIIVVA